MACLGHHISPAFRNHGCSDCSVLADKRLRSGTTLSLSCLLSHVRSSAVSEERRSLSCSLRQQSICSLPTVHIASVPGLPCLYWVLRAVNCAVRQRYCSHTVVSPEKTQDLRKVHVLHPDVIEPALRLRVERGHPQEQNDGNIYYYMYKQGARWVRRVMLAPINCEILSIVGEREPTFSFCACTVDEPPHLSYSVNVVSVWFYNKQRIFTSKQCMRIALQCTRWV